MAIPPEKREALMRRGMELADHVYIDKLDVNCGVARVPTSKTPEEVLQICLELGDDAHWVMIERDMKFVNQHGYWDLGASTMANHPDYFLWIRLNIPVGEALIKEFDLQEKPL